MSIELLDFALTEEAPEELVERAVLWKVGDFESFGQLRSRPGPLLLSCADVDHRGAVLGDQLGEVRKVARLRCARRCQCEQHNHGAEGAQRVSQGVHGTSAVEF